ncbi:hypothetical protein OSB04_018029 [Centaurea solstitialis]|uniref:NB-ARC domain-containing protein n=1 Tax=Centaurea solstitialis TaxID=347529 RepID=A0AA38WLA8_9ASTR|nr:hypothetical protein OSB04_018029 [Centaurea solstitialis]
MANADRWMFMEDLKKIIHGNHQLLINDNPLIISKRPQFQLLYQHLDSIIQTLFGIHEDHHHQHHELEKVRNLKKRFKDVVREAQDSIDLFLSTLHFRYGRRYHISDVFKTSLDRFLSALHLRNRELSPTSDVFKTSLNLKKMLKSMKSIKVELNKINISDMKMDSSSRIDHVKSRQSVAAGTSYTRNPLGIKKLSEEIVVGLHHDVEIIRDKLTEDTKQLCVVSIVGMGGIGKTTLSTKLFNDPFIKYHFHFRAWATVSQTYIRRDFLMQILVSIGAGQEDLQEDDDSKLHEKLHKKLMGRRYLIVIDDIWSIEAFDELKMFFPHNNSASRILLTSCLNEVALHVKPHGFVHYLPCLTEEESWELLKQKVFHGDECPEWLIQPGMQIAKKCHGLPLSVVVMAGVLAKEPMSKDLWKEIACSIGSYHKGCLETLAQSYHHLPGHLRECFLYLGGFPEDFRFNVERLTWLWEAEGFIEEAGNRSLEDTAKAYLMELTNRNLVIVAKRNEIGDLKACKLHDLVRELCVQKAKEEGFFLKIDSPTSSSQLLEGITYEQRRIFINQNVNILNIPHSFTRSIRTLLCFHVSKHPLKSVARSFVLLRALDLRNCQRNTSPQGFALLVHLRYLAIWHSDQLLNSICKLWSLKTLILIRNSSKNIDLPSNITDLVNLRHLWSNSLLCLPYNMEPMKLHSISKVMFKYGESNIRKCFPTIKKFALYDGFDIQIWSNNSKLLPYLENLKLMRLGLQGDIAFPATLKKLSLIHCRLPWSHMSIIQLLPNLTVLKLERNIFTTGTHWDACEQQFRQLKFLMLKNFDIKQWEASTTSFPCLKQLSVSWCKGLEEIPLEIGEIATVELIEIDDCNNSVVESVKRIQQEQQDMGNDELKITVDGKELSFYSSQHGSSEIACQQPKELAKKIEKKYKSFLFGADGRADGSAPVVPTSAPICSKWSVMSCPQFVRDLSARMYLRGNLRQRPDQLLYVQLVSSLLVGFRYFHKRSCESANKMKYKTMKKNLTLLVHLRYLASWYSSQLPHSICNLWSLQTLILIRYGSEHIYLPSNITDLVNLRHLWSNSWLCLRYIEKPMNLHSISRVMLKDRLDYFHKCFPNIKKLALYCDDKYHFELLPYLENLKLIGPGMRWGHIAFPATSKKLSLIRCELLWSHMSIIQLLPNLEVLKLIYNGFKGRQWDACEQQFRQLKLLKLEWLDIKQWEAYSTSFPCLKQLTLRYCMDLEEIPIEIGEITTLELIEIDSCKPVVESVKRIQQEQHDAGNYEIKITVDREELPFYSS